MVVEPAGSAAGPDGATRDELEALEQLRLAVVDGEAAVARGILSGIMARDPSPEVVRAVDDYRRILDGRDLAEQLSLRLVVGPGESDDLTRVELVVESDLEAPATLRLLPPTLVRKVFAVSPLGLESRNRRGEVRVDLEQLELAPSAASIAFLGEFPRQVSGALAVRESFALYPGGAWVERGGELLPVQDLVIVDAERTSVASFLPPGPVDPGAVAEYMGDPAVLEIPDDGYLPALLERAVRVAPSRRADAVERIAIASADWTDEQLTAAAPALRWLTDAITPGSDARAWRQYLSSWNRPPASDAAASLVLPR